MRVSDRRVERCRGRLSLILVIRLVRACVHKRKSTEEYRYGPLNEYLNSRNYAEQAQVMGV